MAAWKEKSLPNGSSLYVSNVEVPLEDDVQCLEDFLSVEDEAQILEAIDDQEFCWEGFDQRRRMQRFALDDEDTNDNPIRLTLQQVRQRLQEEASFRFSHASIEEYAPETFHD